MSDARASVKAARAKKALFDAREECQANKLDDDIKVDSKGTVTISQLYGDTIYKVFFYGSNGDGIGYDGPDMEAAFISGRHIARDMNYNFLGIWKGQIERS